MDSADGLPGGTRADPDSDLSLVIVNWNTRDDLRRCLESLEGALVGLRAQTIVVDNASQDGSAAMVSARFPWAELIVNRRNAGFARANNQAFELARGRFLLLLNPDAVAEAGAIRGLLEFMERTPEAGAAGLQLRFPDGRLQNSYDSLPTFGSEILSKHLLRLLFPARYPSKRVIPSDILAVEIVIGACLILRREVVEALRGFDERYFLFMEEADLCHRIRRAGWEIYHLPHLTVVHNAMASKSQANPQAAVEYARSSYRFWRRCLSPGKGALLGVLKALKALIVNPVLSLAACAITLGTIPRHRRRLQIRAVLWAWHILGCPPSWGMREVSPIRGFRREKSFSREVFFSEEGGAEIRDLALSFDGGEVHGAAEGLIWIEIHRPSGILGRLRALRSVAPGILELERAAEALDRGIPAVLPLAAGAVRRFGLLRFSFTIYRRDPALSLLPSELPEDPAERSECLRSLARFLRRLHDAGVDPQSLRHLMTLVGGRLDPGNLLLSPARSASMGPALLRGERIAALRRLARAEPSLRPLDRRCFLAGYWESPDRRRVRRPLRALHLFANHKVTGPAETALDVARAVDRLPGVEAEFGAGRGPRRENGLGRLAVVRGARVADLGLELRKHFSPLHLLGDILRLREAFRRDPPDVIHCHSQGDHLLAALAAPPEIPIVRSYYGGAAPPWDWRAKLLFRKRSARIILFCESVRTELLRSPFELEPGRLLRLDPPIDLARFDPARPLKDLRPGFGISPGAFAAGIAARLQRHRRFEVLFEALVLARRELPELRFVVIGRGTHAEKVAREPVRRLGLSGTVHIAGYLSGDEYVAALRALDAAVFLFPGSDGTCRAVREELALGLPVIAARRGMLPELIRDGETGILIDDTPENLAGAIVGLARDGERRRRMAAAARADALARFSYESHARAIESVYRSALGAR